MTSMFSDPRIAALYEHVPADQLARLQAFRTRYAPRTVTIRGQAWRYLDTEQGKAGLLLLGGGTLQAENGFQTIEHFAQTYRVIAPDYPPLTLRPWMEGLLGLLDTLEIEQVFVLGGSYGGIMLQPLLRRAPARIARAVIAVAPPPSPSRSAQMARSLRWLRLLPTVLLRALINRSFARLSNAEHDQPGMALLTALSREIVQYRLERADLLAALQRVVDAGNAYPYTPADLDGWTGKLLLLFGGEDPGTPPDVRAAMQWLYPEAETHTFEGAGHIVALSHQQAYFTAIRDFLNK